MAALLDCEAVGSLEVIDASLVVAVTLQDNVSLDEGGAKVPALTATWATIASQYITGIQFEHGPSDLSAGIVLSSANKGMLSWVQTAGLLPVKNYAVRYRAIGAAPNTFGPWVGPTTRKTGAGDSAGTTLTLLPMDANVTIQGNLVYKTAFDGTWNAGGVYSAERNTGSARVSARFMSASYSVMFGLCDDDTIIQGYGRLDYALYVDNVSSYIYESGFNIVALGAHTPGDLYSITYDGEWVRYWKLAVATGAVTMLRETKTTAGRSFRAQIAQVGYGPTSGLKDIQFGPYVDNASNRTLVLTKQPSTVANIRITGNTITALNNNAASQNMVRSEAVTGPCFVEMDIAAAAAWTMLALDIGDDTSGYATQDIFVQYKPDGTNGLQVYMNGLGPYYTDAALAVTSGKLRIVYDGRSYQVFIGGVARTPSFLTTQGKTHYPKFIAFNENVVHTGLAAGSYTDNSVIPIRLYESAGNKYRIIGNSVAKVGGVNGWEAGNVFGAEPQRGAAYISGRMIGGGTFIGLTSTAAPSDTYVQMDYGIFRTGVNVYPYRLGSNLSGSPIYSTADDNTVFAIHYDGTKVRFMVNGVELYTLAAAQNQRLYPAVSINDNAGIGMVSDIVFGANAQAARLGVNVFKNDGSATSQADIYTPEGTAALIAGQGAFATQSALSWTSGQLTSRPALTQGSSVTEDPGTGDPEAWVINNGGAVVAVTSGPMSRSALQSGPSTLSTAVSKRAVPIDATKTYMIEGWYMRDGASNGSFYGAFILEDNTGANISGDGSYWSYGPAAVTPTANVWTYYSRIVGAGTSRPIPSNARAARVGALLNYGATAGRGYVQGLRIVEVIRIGGSLYRQDGTLATEPQIITGLGTAALVAGQTAWATLSDPTTKISRLKTNGRVTNNYTVSNGVLSGATLVRNPFYVLGSAVQSGAARIAIASHTLKGSGISITYSAANIDGLLFSTRYYVFAYDPDLIGGTISYVANTNAEAYAVDDNYFLVGSITTVASGGGAGTPPPVPVPPGSYEDPTCVVYEAWLPNMKQARDIEAGDGLIMMADDGRSAAPGVVEGVQDGYTACYVLETVSGIRLTCSSTTPIPYWTGGNEEPVGYKPAWECDGSEVVPVLDHNGFRWEALACQPGMIGLKPVKMISANNGVFAAGDQRGRFIFTHNIMWKKPI